MTQHTPLDQEPISQEPLDGTPVQEEPVSQQRVDDISFATGEEQDAPMAKQQFIQMNQNAIQGLIDEAFGLQADPSTIEGAVLNQGAKAQDFLSNPEFFLEQALAQRDPETSVEDVQFAVNDRIGQEMIAQMLADEKDSGGFVDAALDFGAMILRETTIGIPEALTDRTERRGTELLWHKINDTPSEFKAFLEGWIADARDESIRSDNVWSMMQLQEEYYSNGVDFNSGLKKAFALLDLSGFGSLGKAALKGSVALAKTSTRVGRSAVIEGAEEAAERAVRATKDAIDPEVATDAGHGTINPHKQPVSSSEGWYNRVIHQNPLMQRFKDLYSSGAAGKVADEANLNDAVLTQANRYQTQVGSPIFRSRLVPLELGRYQAEFLIGKVDGAAYKPLKDGSVPAGVKKRAEQLNGEIVPVNPEDLSQGYVVAVRENLATNKAIGTLDPDELTALEQGVVRGSLGKIFGNQLMGSAALRGVEELTTSAQMGEAFSAAVKREFGQEAKKYTNLKVADQGAINSVLAKLRDDPVEASRRAWYTPEEFALKYKAETGAMPSKAVVEGYEAIVNISDSAAALKAVSIMDRYLEKGYKALDLGDIKVPGRVIDDGKVAADEWVYDADYGKPFLKGDLDEGYGQIYKLDKAQFDGVEYAVKPKGVDELSPENVMGYNAGGPRVNPNANYFVVAEGRRLKTFLTAFTEADARLAARQIDELRQKYPEGKLTDEDVMRLNDWNPEITTVDELTDFMQKHKWRLTDEAINVKARDDDLIASVVDPDDVTTGMKAHEFIENDMRRNDQVLPQFGGGKAFNIDPVTAIADQFGSVAQEFSFRHYTHQAVVGWVKTAQAQGRSWFPSTYASDDYYNLFRDANITGTDDFANRMREIRSIEMRRMHMKGESGKYMEALGQKASEYVFQKTGVATKIGDPVEAISNKMLSLGFHSAFGFLNYSQVLVQGSHAITIGAASPKGWQGATLALATRAFSTESPDVIREMANRLAKTTGFKPDEIQEMMDYLRTSGRDVVDGDAIEQGTGVSYGLSGWRGESYKPSKLQAAYANSKKVGAAGLDKGLLFFNAGERLSRRTGIFTAILEFKAKNPGIPLNDDVARRWITRREQDLSFNMTTSSRPLAQSGVMKVPTQWLSHTFRAMETVFVGRNFTKAERARMAAVLFPMYGLAGFGAQNAAGYLADKFGISEDSAAFTTLKWGVIDGLTDWLLPDTDGKQASGLAPRLAPVGAVLDTYRKVTEGKFHEVAFGPSGEIGSSLYGAVMSAASSVINGRDVMLTEDLVKIIRQPSGVDNIFKAYGIFQNGTYRSKNGVTIPGEMNVTDGIMTLLGITTLKQTEWYDIRTSVFRSNRQFTKARKEYNMMAEKAFVMLEDPEKQERAIELFDELHAQITLSGFSFAQQAELRRAISRRLEDQWLDLNQQLLKQERYTDQQRIGKTLGRFE